MKKFFIFIALVLWGFAQVLEAQNRYFNHLSTGVSRPNSAASVVHSNGYIYFFQADYNTQTLSVTELDPITMLPTGNAKYLTLNIDFIINGAFEDFNGDFVLFGYDNSNYCWKPAYIVITQNLSFINTYHNWHNLSGQFTSGCFGYDLNGMAMYVFVLNTGELIVAAISTSGNIVVFTANLNSNYFDHYTDISWDDSHQMFIATGSIWNGVSSWLHPFVDVFKYDLPNDSITFQNTYLIDNQSYSGVSVGQALHTKLSNNHLLLYQDLRSVVGSTSIYDVIWMTRIKDYWNSFASIEESWFYVLPNAKLSAKDMLYDPINNRLNLLGVFDYCGEAQIFAQVDPYRLYSGINIGQLGIGFSISNTCTNLQPPAITLYTNDFDMKNLALDIFHPCQPVLVAGTGNKQPILTETYDIAHSICDEWLWHQDAIAMPVLKPYTLNCVWNNMSMPPSPANPQQDNIILNKMCADSYSCFHKDGEGKSLKQSLSNSKPVAEITIEDNSLFLCDGFEGDIKYSFYDMAGKLLQQGKTRNGERNTMKYTTGIYLLKATDTFGNQVVKKIVLL